MQKVRILFVVAALLTLYVGFGYAEPVYFGWQTQATLAAEDFEDDPTFGTNTRFYAKYTDPVKAQQVEINLKGTISDAGDAVTITWNKKVMLYNKKSLDGKQYSTEILKGSSSPVQDLQLEIYTDDGKGYEKDAYLANPLIQYITTDNNEDYTLTGMVFGPQKVKIYQEYAITADDTTTYGYKSCKVTDYIITDEETDSTGRAAADYQTYQAIFKAPTLKTGQTATGYFIVENKIGITAGKKSMTYDEYFTLYNQNVAVAETACTFDDNQNRDTDYINKNLWGINNYNSNLIWDDKKEKVLVVSWKYSKELAGTGTGTDFPDNVPIGEEQDNIYGPMFVSLAPEVRNYAKQYKYGLQSEENIRYQLAQIHGMPPYVAVDEVEFNGSTKNGYNIFMEMWVEPKYLVRPCPDPEITDTVAEENFTYTANSMLSVLDNYKAWFEGKLVSSYKNDSNDPWPFTGYGYSYNWLNAEQTVYGVSEFIILPVYKGEGHDGKYTLNRLVPTVQYLTDDDDAYKYPGKYY